MTPDTRHQTSALMRCFQEEQNSTCVKNQLHLRSLSVHFHVILERQTASTQFDFAENVAVAGKKVGDQLVVQQDLLQPTGKSEGHGIAKRKAITCHRSLGRVANLEGEGGGSKLNVLSKLHECKHVSIYPNVDLSQLVQKLIATAIAILIVNEFILCNSVTTLGNNVAIKDWRPIQGRRGLEVCLSTGRKAQILVFVLLRISLLSV